MHVFGSWDRYHEWICPLPHCKWLVDTMTRAICHGQIKVRLTSEERDCPRQTGWADHMDPTLVSFPFIPDLHYVFIRLWGKPVSVCVHARLATSYSNVKGLVEHGYAGMNALWAISYLAQHPLGRLKLCHPGLTKLHVNAWARCPYVAACQAGGSLHTMTMLKTYQSDLLKDLDLGDGVHQDAVLELFRTTDLALCATEVWAAWLPPWLILRGIYGLTSWGSKRRK